MKPAAYNDTQLLYHTDEDERPGEVWGVVLAGDYTAEHEQGIKSLLKRLGIDPEGLMVEGRSMAGGGRTINSISGQVTETHSVPAPTDKNPQRTARKKIISKPISLSTSRYFEKMADVVRQATRWDFDKPVTGAWDEKDFAIIAWSDDAKSFLRSLTDAFAAGDVTMWIGGAGSNPFARGGLIIGITSRLPAKGVETLNDMDDDTRRLAEATQKTGIEDLLRDAVAKGKIQSKPWLPSPWHALAPAWSSPKDQTKFEVKFYLNPGDQQLYKHGWFTVEELQAWAEGKGPIVKPAQSPSE